LARVLQKVGRSADAIKASAQALRTARSQARGRVVAPAPQAVAELERRLTPSPLLADYHYALASQMNVFPPSQVPNAGVATLFDKYAERFDEHLVEKLQYHVPEMIAAAVAPAVPDRPLEVLDLGCGTGLCGPLLRPMAIRLCGIDLSPVMIEKARARNIYDQLEVGDMVAALRASPRLFDLLVAADVLIYLGDLTPTFEAAATALRPGGVFAYTVEAGEGERYQLQKIGRFNHSPAYLHRLAEMFGFEEVSFDEIAVRTENEKPVRGFLVVLRWTR
jgi:predicted TPR repeat methyltransferase